MRSIVYAAAIAALSLVAVPTDASADSWADSVNPYRNMGWTGSTADYGARRAARAAEADDERPARARSQARRVAAVEASDEDRPQRRTRTARPSRGSVGSGSVAESGGTVGMASYYWQPQRVASGGWFNPNAMTAAHKTLPFGTRVRVTHMGNGQSVEVTINDRGPYIAGRIIDLSRAAASAINMTGQGVARIRMTVLGR
jgi:rare lipoprotein A